MLKLTDIQGRWLLIVGVILIDIVWVRATGIEIFFLKAVTFPLSVLAVGLFYTYLRPVPRIAHLMMTFAQLSTFTLAAGLFSYLALTARFPLIDAQLATIDAAWRLDWPSSYRWTRENPHIERILWLAYVSATPQAPALLIIFSVLKRTDRAEEFIWLFALAGSVAALVSLVLPAESAWTYYNVAPYEGINHLAHFEGLRNGTMTRIDLADMIGVVTFPSFHAALCLIFTYVARGVLILFPAMALLNLTMLAATPVIGGHHFVDLPAGLLIAVGVIMVVRQGRAAAARRPQSAIARA